MVTIQQKFELFLMMLRSIVNKTKKGITKNKSELDKYRADAGKKIAVFLKDAKKAFWFNFDEFGRANFGFIDDKTTMKLLAYFVKGMIGVNPDETIGCFVITDMDTIFRLREGKMPYLNQKTNQVEYYRYTVLDARQMGHLSVYGEGSNVSLLKFATFLEEHPDMIKEVIG